jgi:hypothetical protein
MQISSFSPVSNFSQNTGVKIRAGNLGEVASDALLAAGGEIGKVVIEGAAEKCATSQVAENISKGAKNCKVTEGVKEVGEFVSGFLGEMINAWK